MALDNINLLVFKVGSIPCCLDSVYVQVVIEPPKRITSIPGSNALHPGIFSYMNKMVAVYDVRSKFNLSTEQTGIIIITEINQRLFGFWVDSIEEIISSNDGEWQPIPLEGPENLFDAVLLYNDKLIFNTSFENMLKAKINTQAQLFINNINTPNNDSDKQKETETTSATDIQETIPHPATPANTINEEDEIIPAANNTISTPLPEVPQVVNQLLLAHLPSIKPAEASPIVIKEKQENTPPLQYKHNTTADKATTNNSATLIQPLFDKTKPSRTSTTENQNELPAELELNTTQATQNTQAPERPLIPSANLNITINKKTRSYSIEKANNKKITGPAVLLLFIAAVGIGYYVYLNFNIIKTPLSTSIKKQFYEPMKEITTSLSEPLPPAITEPLKKPELIESSPAAENAIELEQKTVTNNKTNITKEKNTITITIEDSEAKFNTVIDKKYNDTETVETGNKITLDKATNTAKKKPIKPIKITKRIIHIVTKGDTLWEIAKQHIHDPYKYKELAKLSKIKNPDLIYPGNRIVIIIKR